MSLFLRICIPAFFSFHSHLIFSLARSYLPFLRLLSFSRRVTLATSRLLLLLEGDAFFCQHSACMAALRVVVARNTGMKELLVSFQAFVPRARVWNARHTHFVEYCGRSLC